MENKIVLRNKEFQNIDFTIKNSQKSEKNKGKRLEIFNLNRRVQKIIAEEIIQEQALDYKNFSGLEKLNFATAEKVLKKLLNAVIHDHCVQDCLIIIGNIASDSDSYCEILNNFGIVQVLFQKFDYENEGQSEKIIWCLGNISVGSVSAKQFCIDLNVIGKIIDYLKSDFEKTDETIQSCLKTISSIIYQSNYSLDLARSILNLIDELIENEEFIEHILIIIYTISLQYPHVCVLIFLRICSLELKSNSQKLIFLEIVQILFSYIDSPLTIKETLAKFIGKNPQLNSKIYEILMDTSPIISQIKSDFVYYALFDLNSHNVTLTRNASRFLITFQYMEQGKIFETFQEKELLELEKSLLVQDSESLNYLLELCNILFEAGLHDKLQGVINSLSIAYFKSIPRITSKIEDLFNKFNSK